MHRHQASCPAKNGSLQILRCVLRRRLSLADRATMVPLLGALLDYDATPEAYERYDRMTALELFQK